MREPAAHALDRSGACEEYCPHPEELAKQASRRMDTTHELAAILRDARKCALLRMRKRRVIARSQRGAMTRDAPQLRLQRRRYLLGSVSLGQVDHGVHRRGEFVDVADVGEIPLPCDAEALRRHAFERVQSDI